MSGWSIISDSEAAPEPTPISAERADLLGVKAAPYGPRVLATVIDAVPAVVFAIPLAFLPAAFAGAEGPNVLLLALDGVGLLLLVLYGLLQLISHGRRGQTFGKQMMRLRTIRATTFKPIGFGRALGRAAIVAASGIVPVIGTAVLFFSITRDAQKRGRGWHDHAVDAWVIDLRELDPTDPVAFENARGRARVRSVGMATQGTASSFPGPHAATAAGGPSDTGFDTQHPSRAAFETSARPPAPPQRRADPVIQRVPAPPQPAAPQRTHAQRATAPVPGTTAAHPAAPGPRVAAPRPGRPEADRSAGASPASGPHRVARVRLDDGSDIAVTQLTLIGRRPAAEHGAAVVAIDDETRSISKTHLALHVDAHGLVVTDRGSTNGSGLIRAGVETPLGAGRPQRAQPGDRIRFGDRHLDVR